MKLFFLLLIISSSKLCFSQDSTHILKKIYESKLPKRLFRLKDTSNNYRNFYDYVKENRKPYRVNIYQIGTDTAYNFIFVDSSLFYCGVVFKSNSKKKHNGYRYWVYNKRLFNIVSNRNKLANKLAANESHLFILDKADEAYRKAESFLVNH